MSDVFRRFRESVGWNPQVIEIELTKCQVCGHRFGGVLCPSCGWTEDDEPNILQRFVKSMRVRNVANVVKSSDWSAELQVCAYCGSQFSRTLDKCVHCGKEKASTAERFLRSLRL